MFLGMFKFQVCLGHLLGLQSPDAKEGSFGHGKVLSHKRSRVQTCSNYFFPNVACFEGSCQIQPTWGEANKLDGHLLDTMHYHSFRIRSSF